MTSENPPDSEEVAEALFTVTAALQDARERLAGGAQRSGVTADDVFESVWEAYDIDSAAEIAENVTYAGDDSPANMAITARRENPSD